MNSLSPLSKLEEVTAPDEAIVVFGGTFDPMHQGHIEVIQSLRKKFAHVIIAPTIANPWKEKAPSPIKHRAKMIQLICKAEEIDLRQDVTDAMVSLDASGYTFVSDYVQALRKTTAAPIFWAVGRDIADTVPQWRDWDTLGITAVVHPVNIDIHASDIRKHQADPHPAILDYCKKHSLY